jgi:hypothetical protein
LSQRNRNINIENFLCEFAVSLLAFVLSTGIDLKMKVITIIVVRRCQADLPWDKGDSRGIGMPNVDITKKRHLNLLLILK